MNDYQFKLVKIEGEFIWHNHPDTDEVFIVIEGSMVIELEDGKVELWCWRVVCCSEGRDAQAICNQ